MAPVASLLTAPFECLYVKAEQARTLVVGVGRTHCLEARCMSRELTVIVDRLLLLLLPPNSIAQTMPCSPTVLGCAALLVNMARHSLPYISNIWSTHCLSTRTTATAPCTMLTPHKPHIMHSNTIIHQQE
jgi:hypothetical protein